jgi:YidC/Oxa1 family membrane protein insertase
MDRRTVLAVVLMAIVIVGTQILFPSRRAVPPVGDSTRVVNTAPAATPTTPSATTSPQNPAAPAITLARPESLPAAALPQQSATVSVLTTPKAEYSLRSPGAAPSQVRIPTYRQLDPGADRSTGVVLRSNANELLSYRLVRGADTVALDTIPFAVSQSGSSVTFQSPIVTLTYKTAGDNYRAEVRGTVPNAPAGSVLLINLPSTIESVEADTAEDMRHLAYGFKRPLRDVESVSFSKLDSLRPRVDTGSMQWVTARTKYWLVALMSPVRTTDSTPAFRGLVTRGGKFVGKVAQTAYAQTAYPLKGDQIAFDIYAGPQSWEQLHALGNDLENVNPYAGFMHAVVQPFATIVMRTLLWMKATFRVNYGWVLVIFGVVIRLALWPLNQKAMRSSIQMQRLQPELAEIQRKYKDDREKQQQAMMKLYAAHGMSPLTPMLGCLPMLLPTPVLFALYFVFQNTIEFRDVHFLWLPDLSLRDPFFIMPVLMGASMFLLSWIGMRGVPPNPQAKMMSYMMPVMFVFFFFNLASGLNLYYAVQNIAALPQQLLLSRERAKANIPAAKPSGVKT